MTGPGPHEHKALVEAARREVPDRLFPRYINLRFSHIRKWLNDFRIIPNKAKTFQNTPDIFSNFGRGWRKEKECHKKGNRQGRAALITENENKQTKLELYM